MRDLLVLVPRLREQWVRPGPAFDRPRLALAGALRDQVPGHDLQQILLHPEALFVNEAALVGLGVGQFDGGGTDHLDGPTGEVAVEGLCWISQGYVQDRGPGAGGACYQWTRKVRWKTVSVALSKEHYAALKEAIRGWREMEAIVDRMQQLSRQMIFGTLQDIRRRKPLPKKTVGLN